MKLNYGTYFILIKNSGDFKTTSVWRCGVCDAMCGMSMGKWRNERSLDLKIFYIIRFAKKYFVIS